MEILKNVLEFLVFTVIVKMIVGHWIAQKIVQWATKANARNMTIWQHWLHEARGQGHQSSLMGCSDCPAF